MADNRLARELDTRTNVERPKQWKPPELLPEPDKLPGYTYRWVRTSTLGRDDPKNFSFKMREGWEPVKTEEQPQFLMLTDPNSRFKDNIEIAGLLLCKTPTEMVQQRNEHYSGVAKKQMEAVDNSFMEQNDPRMPLFSEKKSTASFGKGK